MFFSGQRPAVNAGISVSRVGGNAQTKAMKQVANKVKLEIAQYAELASFSQFGSDIDKDTKERLDHGQLLMEILKQGQYKPMSVAHQVMIIYAAVNKHLADISIGEIKEFEKGFLAFVDEQYPSIAKSIESTGKLEEGTEETLKEAIAKYKEIR